MGKYRIYPQKSNTLIEDTNVNTGENEVAELWYGTEGRTRYLFQFSFDSYNAAYALGYTPSVTATTTQLKLTNCYPIFTKYPYQDAVPATSVDIEVYAIQQAWDSGVGYDFVGRETVDGFSNWYSATTTVPWSAAGGDYADMIFSGHVDKGYEDLESETLDYDLLWHSFTGNNYGMLVKYTDVTEALTGSAQSILKYYTENANITYKMPYIELSWDNQVKDERDEVGHGLTRRLYLYIKRSGIFARPYSISGVSIDYDSQQYSDEVYPESAITEQYPGVYYIEFTCPDEQQPAVVGESFEDTWHVQFYPGEPYTSVTQSASMHAESTQWDTSQTYVLETVEYAVTMPNLATRYNQGDIVYLDVRAYEQYTSNVVVLKSMEYKIVLIDGGNNYNHTMVDWEPVSYTQDLNGLPLNTAWFHPEYFYEIQFRYTVNGAVNKTPKDKFKFKVIESV